MSVATKARVAIEYALESHAYTLTPRSIRQRWAVAKLNKTKLHILNHILERQSFEPNGAHIYIDTLSKVSSCKYQAAQKNLSSLHKEGWVELIGNPMMGYYMRLSLPEADAEILLETSPRRALIRDDLKRTSLVRSYQYNNTPRTHKNGFSGVIRKTNHGESAPARLSPLARPSEGAAERQTETTPEQRKTIVDNMKAVREQLKLKAEREEALRDEQINNNIIKFKCNYTKMLESQLKLVNISSKAERGENFHEHGQSGGVTGTAFFSGERGNGNSCNSNGGQ